MIKFIENSTSIETIFEDGISFQAKKTPLIQNLLKPNYENEDSPYSIKKEDDSLVKISETFVLKINIKNIGTLYVTFDKELLDDEKKKSLIDSISILKAIKSKTKENREEKINKVLEGLIGQPIYFAIFDLKDNITEIVELLKNKEISYPFIVLNEDELEELEIIDEENKDETKKESFFKKFAKAFKRNPIIKDIRKHPVSYGFNVIGALLISLMILLVFVLFQNNDSGYAIVLLAMITVFLFVIFVNNKTYYSERYTFKLLKNHYPAVIAYNASIIIFAIIGTVIGYVLAHNFLEKEDVIINYAMSISPTIVITILLFSLDTLITLIVLKKTNQE